VLLAAVLLLVVGEFQPAPRPTFADHTATVFGIAAMSVLLVASAAAWIPARRAAAVDPAVALKSD
jgi:ABC-type antimicrobial peptide transport system permease subunit